MTIQAVLPLRSVPYRPLLLWGGMAALVLAACLLPAVEQPVSYHAFADQRAWGELPHAADVLSNLPFLLAAIAGAVLLWRSKLRSTDVVAYRLLALFFAGLAATSVGSFYYHWMPTDASLVWDRAGMSIAFAGLLGFAVQTRWGDQPGRTVAWAVLLAAPLSIAVWAATANVLPWALLQGAGMLLCAGLAFVPARNTAVPIAMGQVIAFYAASKVMELCDERFFSLSHHLLSGHSLKHLLAAAAALPVLYALYVRGSAVESKQKRM